MNLLAWIGRLERWLCTSGFIVMSAALVLDVAFRLFVGRGVVGAPQVGLVGMMVTALFGLGLAADAGDHFRPRVLDDYVPEAIADAFLTFSHLVTACFFALLAWLALWVARESYALDDVTPLLRWPVGLLQCVLVLAFSFNILRYLTYAFVRDARPSEHIDQEAV